MDPSLSYLHEREKVMVRARWAVLAAALALLQFRQVRDALAAPLWVAYLIIAVPAAYNAGAGHLLRHRYRPADSRLLLVLDCLVASAGVAVSGGLKSPATFFYLFMVGTATRLGGLAGGLLFGCLAVAAAGAATLAAAPLDRAEMLWSAAFTAAPLLTMAFFLSVEFQEADRYRARLAREAERLARADERARLCREVHDSILGTLVAAGLKLNHLASGCVKKGCRDTREIQRVGDLLYRGLTALRGFTRASEHVAEADEGPLATLRCLAEALNCGGGKPRVELVLRGDEKWVPRAVAKEVEKIVREALVNAFRHSDADHVRAEVIVQPNMLEVIVFDDGVGFNPAAAAGMGLGLGAMRERAGMVGGRVEVESRPGGGGTVVRLRVPLAWEVEREPSGGG